MSLPLTISLLLRANVMHAKLCEFFDTPIIYLAYALDCGRLSGRTSVSLAAPLQLFRLSKNDRITTTGFILHNQWKVQPL